MKSKRRNSTETSKTKQEQTFIPHGIQNLNINL